MSYLHEIAKHHLRMTPLLSEMRKAADFLDWLDRFELTGIQALFDCAPIPIPPSVDAGWVAFYLNGEGREDESGLSVYQAQNGGWEVAPAGTFRMSLIPTPTNQCPDSVEMLHNFRKSWPSTYYFLESFMYEHGEDRGDLVGPLRPMLRLLARYKDEVSAAEIPF